MWDCGYLLAACLSRCLQQAQQGGRDCEIVGTHLCRYLRACNGAGGGGGIWVHARGMSGLHCAEPRSAGSLCGPITPAVAC